MTLSQSRGGGGVGIAQEELGAKDEEGGDGKGLLWDPAPQIGFPSALWYKGC